jgi:hypothetical protein
MDTQQSPGSTKNCPKCGESIQASAKKCKHCQADLRNWFSRHKIITGILILIVIGIIGIANGDKTEKVATSDTRTAKVDATEATAQTDSAPAAPAKNEDKTDKVGDSVKLGGAIVTVNQVATSMGSQYSKPQAGNKWINLNVTIENTESTEQYVTTMGQMFLRDGDGNSYQVAVTDKTTESVNNNLDGTIIANSKRTGWVGFEVKKDAKNLQFQYNGSMWGGGNIMVDLVQ